MASVHACLVAASIAVSGIVATQESRIRSGTPSSVRVVTADQTRFREGPWAFVKRGSETAPLQVAQYRRRLVGDVRIRLDDQRLGSLRVEQGGCDPPQSCAPPDCGCFSSDSHWIYVVDSKGDTVARIHLWAAHGDFDIVPFDLVDGPGDELLIVRVLGRSSPPNGHDLKILKLVGATAVELLQAHTIAGNLSGDPMVCGLWRSRLTIDPEAVKPRPIRVQNDVFVAAGCRLDEPARAEAIRRHQPVLTYSRGRYAIR